jgi:peptidoglycan biosynthesis protein MviN/MurJ (putative lipid II flippase)
MLLATGCYAKKSYGLPASASVVAVLLNTALNGLMVFVFHWGVLSIALATSLSAFLNGAILSRRLPSSFWLFLFRLTLVSGIAAMTTLFLGKFWLHDATLEICRGNTPLLSRTFPEQLLQLMGMTVLFLGSFCISAWALGLSENFSFIYKRKEETSSSQS